MTVLAAGLWSAVATIVLTRLIGAMVGTRVNPEQEYDGLDLAAHGERAYDHT